MGHAPLAGRHELVFSTHAGEAEHTRDVTAAARATSIVCTLWQQSVTLRARSHTASLAERTAIVRTHTPLRWDATPIAPRRTRPLSLAHSKSEAKHAPESWTHSQRLAIHAP